MRLGKKLRIATILMSMAMAATTLIFATFAITQNSADADYDGVLKIIGNADIDVEIKLIEVKSGKVLYTITADEKGIVEKKDGVTVKEVKEVAELTTYAIVTKPELNLGDDYKFAITIKNRNVSGGGTGFAVAKIGDVSFVPAEGFSNYFNTVNPSINEENNKLNPGQELQLEIYLSTKSDAVLESGEIEFSYTLNIEANKVTA